MGLLTEHGTLVLADISGYTAYLEKVELEHAHDILTELLAVIVDQFRALLTISKLEGDAVFARVSDRRLPRPEALLELIENTYLAFRQHRDSTARRTTCACRACQGIPTLDLKFFVHRGEYIVQHISGIQELVGPDVNLIHRLTKNHVSEQTGWKAYLLFTQAALEGLTPLPEGLREQGESYEHIGDVKIYCQDLWTRYETLREARKIILSPEEADLSLSCDLPAPIALVWQMVTDIRILTQTMHAEGAWTGLARPGGRLGVGARNHCSHGKGPGMEYLYLDWRPFHYFTAEGREGSMTHREMFLVEELPGGKGTRFHVRLRITDPALPRPLRRIILNRMAKKGYLDFFVRLGQLISQYSESSSLNPAAEAA